MLYLCGYNESNPLGEKSNNESKGGSPIICPFVKSQLDVNSILSYSIYNNHASYIDKSNTVRGIGDNNLFQISPSLSDDEFDQYNTFVIKDSDDRTWIPTSVACGSNYTLYIVSDPSDRSLSKVAFSFCSIESKNPLFLNIGDLKPLALFGGCKNSAFIESNGGIVFIPESHKESPDALLSPYYIPTAEKAVSVACCHEFIVVLGEKGNVYHSPFVDGQKLTFSIVSELKNVVDISGTFKHCFAVNDKGEVFGFGSNYHGKLGLGMDCESVEEFVKIEQLKKFKIKNAYAGVEHSLFLTIDGDVMACGCNDSGEIPGTDSPSSDNVYSIFDTKIKNAAFCIAGYSVSAIFVQIEPPNCSNKRITINENENEKDRNIQNDNQSGKESKCCILI